jgi:hypothetical protein
MNASKRIATLAIAAVVGVGGAAAPALAASSGHWSKTQCASYTKTFAKKSPHATKGQKSAANKVLKGHACTVVVK